MEKYKIGDIVKGKVTGIENYGIFVLVDEDIAGLIHISEISSSFVRNVEDYAKINDIIEAKVIEYDEKNKKLKLSIKDLENISGSKKSPIKETKSGFTELKNHLDEWIDLKKSEIDEKN